ncbi:acyltransferase family protein [Arsenicicoccus dermatophilus]|uniref:acyltransferase family protein n=1 Tax=Arsenicicoccus dermatophilus TaxID=1076331 RepID=UPI001F4CFE8B|nr:acyltransferase [Arsenicicoccus dermatophilus]MCH8612242.1 acyltransferase [Arsenicicoccus dermatophilus]
MSDSVTAHTAGAHLAGPLSGERIAWIDTARALAVVGVVLFHIGFLHYQPQLGPAVGGPAALWHHVDGLLGSFRMPMLLMLSGVLAAGKVRRGLRSGTAVESSVANYYLYVVWLGVYLLVIPDETFPLGVADLPDLARQVLLPDTTLWFIQCLALGVLLLTALRRVPAAVVVGVLALLHLVVQSFPSSDQMWVRTLPYYVYLAVGVHLAARLRRLTDSPLATAAAGVVFAGAWVLLQLTEGDGARPVHAVANLVACLAAAVLLMGVARLLCLWRPVATVGSFVGRRTLEIYVLHLPMVAALRMLPADRLDGLRGVLAAHPALALAYPPVVACAFVALSLALRVLLDRIGLRWLFTMPEPLCRQVRRWRAPQEQRHTASVG